MTLRQDFATGASSTYNYRWQQFVTTLQADYPNLRKPESSPIPPFAFSEHSLLGFMATTYVNNPVLSPTPKTYDAHVYNYPAWFTQNSATYDTTARNGMTYFEGEYAVISTATSDIYNNRIPYPILQGSVSEAAFMMGFERNADIVFAASYAPLLGHATQYQWTPNLITFDAGSVVKSTSYYVQQLFSTYRGDSYLPSTLASTSGTVFWSVVKQNSPASYIIKVANSGTAQSSLVFNLPTAVGTSGTLIQLSGSASASNTPTAPSNITPHISTIATTQKLSFTAPAISFSVIIIPLSGSSTPPTTVPHTTTSTTATHGTSTSTGGGGSGTGKLGDV